MKKNRLFWSGILVAGLALAVLPSCAQQAFYHPDRHDYTRPEHTTQTWQDVFFHSKDSTKLHGRFAPATGTAKGTVIHVHGNAQNLSAHWDFVSWLPAQGYNVFAFDYRGYGRSEGKPDVRGLFDDTNAALDYIRSRRDLDANKLLVFGQSLGGTNAIAAVGAGNKQGIRAVAIEATFANYAAIANDKITGAGLLMNNRYSADRHIASISPIPLLLIHGDADSVIHVKHAHALFAAARAPKKLIIVPNGEHIDALSHPHHRTRYRHVLTDFFQSAL